MNPETEPCQRVRHCGNSAELLIAWHPDGGEDGGNRQEVGLCQPCAKQHCSELAKYPMAYQTLSIECL